MRKLMLAMALIMLVGCSNSNTEVNDAESAKETKEVKKISENNDINTREFEGSPEEDQEVELFWEVYIGDEIIDAVNSGEKVYDFEVDAPLFEDALIDSLTEREDKDWTPYFGSFNANISDQASPEYIQAMNNAYLAVLDNYLDLDLAIEYIKEAKKIREELK